MHGPLTPAEYEQLHTELDNAEPLTLWHWTIIGVFTAVCLGALWVGAEVAGVL